MEDPIIHRRVHIPGLYQLHQPVPEPLPRQHHELIAVRIPLHPLPVLHIEAIGAGRGIIRIIFILMKSLFLHTEIEGGRHLHRPDHQEYHDIVSLCLLHLFPLLP